ncbi:MAG: transporter substrate-binding domain-containing protein [Clostridiales bacterium]|nr:transporter substrate-binding domain-containing protein [Clostridiales bacterium]
MKNKGTAFVVILLLALLSGCAAGTAASDADVPASDADVPAAGDADVPAASDADVSEVALPESSPPSASPPSASPQAYSSYRDIPGVTDEEVRAVEALLAKRDHFVYGMPVSTEAFVDADGEPAGFSALFCDWLTGMFGVPFKPETCEFKDLIPALKNGDVDFAGSLAPTEERKKIYFMTDAIAERYIVYFRLASGRPVEEIMAERPIRLAVLEDTASANLAISSLEPGSFELTPLKDNYDAYGLLKAGEIDAFVHSNTTENVFDGCGDIVTEDFYPITITPVCMTAQNPQLEPVISVVQKAIENSDPLFLSGLYRQGYNEYRKNKLAAMLTEEEKAYLRSHGTVMIAAEYFNYPVSFYNNHEKQWQGIYFDVLDEVGQLTGLSFVPANDEHTPWPDLMGMLEAGDASIVDTLVRSQEREGRFIWPQTPVAECHYVLLSKPGRQNITITDIPGLRIGASRNTVYLEFMRVWFPDHEGILEYDSTDEALAAMDRGEVDMVMADEYKLLALTNYYETYDYEINFKFNSHIQQTTFGFNKDEAALCSIFDKALALIDVDVITQQWMGKVYDYGLKLAEAQRPWLTGIASLACCVIALMAIFMLKRRYDKKRLEELVAERTGELEVQTSMLSAIFNAIPDQIFCKGLDLMFTDLNDSMEAFFERPASEILGKNEVDGLGLPPELAVEHDALERRVIEESLTIKFEECVPDPHGRVVIFETIKTPLIQNGVTVGMLGIARDISHHKATEEAAILANQSKSEFLATMSHEIRTPMNAILGITEIQLNNESLDPGTREALGKIYSSGDLLLGIINDILDLSKIEAGKLELVIGEYDTASLINDTVQLNIMRIGSKPVEFILEIDEGTPASLTGDELRIRQMMNNLLSNAFKYTQEGHVKLSVSCEARAPGGDGFGDCTLVLEVSDTGQGMTKEQLQTIFDEYTRFQQHTNRMTEGTGLGMNITQNLVSMMGGEISVSSEPGVGSVFTVRIPQTRAGDAAMGRELVESLQQFRQQSLTRMKNARLVYEPMPYGSVLIVDDVETNIYVAKGLLAPYGLKTDSADSGFAAIDKIKQGNVYDIVFMDHMMPKMDGLETTRIIREMGYTSPIVALTANVVTGQSDILLESGFDDFISKPIDIRQMNAVLKRLVRDKQAPEVLEQARAKAESDKNHVADKAGKCPGLPSNPKLAEVFLRDVTKSLGVLGPAAEADGSYSVENMRTYIIHMHGLKSVLANVGNHDLSDMARKLEMAGRDGDAELIKADTPAFLAILQGIVDDLTPGLEDQCADAAGGDGDMDYLREKMLCLREACISYDESGAEAAMKDLGEKAWPGPVKEMLDKISVHILHCDCEEVAEIVEGFLEDA